MKQLPQASVPRLALRRKISYIVRPEEARIETPELKVKYHDHDRNASSPTVDHATRTCFALSVSSRLASVGNGSGAG